MKRGYAETVDNALFDGGWIGQLSDNDPPRALELWRLPDCTHAVFVRTGTKTETGGWVDQWSCLSPEIPVEVPVIRHMVPSLGKHGTVAYPYYIKGTAIVRGVPMKQGVGLTYGDGKIEQSVDLLADSYSTATWETWE